jgi:hypothetical protein
MIVSYMEQQYTKMHNSGLALSIERSRPGASGCARKIVEYGLEPDIDDAAQGRSGA